MLVRDAGARIEVYMARRSARRAIMPDAYVFPGGALDERDASERVVARLDGVPNGIDAPFAVAALRELLEEAGVLLAATSDGCEPAPAQVAAARAALASGTDFAEILERGGWQLRGSELAYYSRWITPPGEVARRFDARFFAARAPDGQAAAADAVEVHDGVWIAPADALQRFERGEWTIVFPTLRHLERLTAFASVAEFVAHARTRRPVPVMPDMTPEGAISLPAALQAW